MGNRLITFEGTSIDVGGNSLQNYVAYYSQVPTTMQSPATAGASISDWQARIATTQASLHATDLNILVLGGPANNFGNTGTQAAELASYLSYVASMKSYGTSSGKKLKIVASTMLPQTNATFNAYRPTFATAIKARLGNDIDAVIDYGIDGVFGPNATGANTLYFGDGIHPTVKGQANMARVSAPVLDTFLNVTTGVRRFRAASGGVPIPPDTTAPILSSATDTKTGSTTGTITVSTDEANGTLYYVLSSSATTPTAAQIIAGNDHTGSPAVKSGSAAVEATGVQTFNITGLANSTTYYAHFAQRDAANNSSAPVSGNGMTTDAPASAVVGTFRSAPAFPGAALAVTFASQPIGTADTSRVVVVVLQSHMVGGGNVMTMTIGGVAATSVGDQGNGTEYINMFYATVPIGTTADIVITSSIWTLNAQIAVYTVTGSSGTPRTNSWMPFGSVIAGSMTVTATVPTGGLGIAGFCTDRDVLPTTWSNATLDLGRVNAVDPNNTDIFALSTTTVGSVSPTSGTETTFYAAVMTTWGP
jgi:lysophospholipase L1-like esterase